MHSIGNKLLSYNLWLFSALVTFCECLVCDVDYVEVVLLLNLYSDIHQVFSDSNLYMKMIENMSQIFQCGDEMFIPIVTIGKVIEHLFEKIKPVGFDHFLKLYEFMFSNLI